MAVGKLIKLFSIRFSILDTSSFTRVYTVVAESKLDYKLDSRASLIDGIIEASF